MHQFNLDKFNVKLSPLIDGWKFGLNFQDVIMIIGCTEGAKKTQRFYFVCKVQKCRKMLGGAAFLTQI